MGARAVADVEPGIIASAVLVAHQAELDGGRIMLDSASFIGAALQGNAGHEGWGGFVEVVVCLIWRIGIVVDAPGWAVGGRWCLSLVVFCLWLHWSPLPWPLGVWWGCQGESEAEDEVKRESGWLRENRGGGQMVYVSSLVYLPKHLTMAAFNQVEWLFRYNSHGLTIPLERCTFRASTLASASTPSVEKERNAP